MNRTYELNDSGIRLSLGAIIFQHVLGNRACYLFAIFHNAETLVKPSASLLKSKRI